MKNKLLKFLTLILSVSAILCFSIACVEGDEIPSHEHNYTKEVISNEFKLSDATCTQKAKYYYSCECGEKGEETFEHGEYAHIFSETWSLNDTHHWKDAICGCDEIKNYDKHEVDNFGCCIVCEQPVIPTEGIVYEEKSNSAVVIDYIGESKKVKIADTYNNLPVKTIAQDAFRDSDIKLIVIPSSVVRIDKEAFAGCIKLEKVEYIKDYWGCSVQSIGYGAFSGCVSLKSIELPLYLREISPYLFSNCASLETVIFRCRVSTIGHNAFLNCFGLKTIYAPEKRYFDKIYIEEGNSHFYHYSITYYYVDPTDPSTIPTDGGNYWHYVNGVPTKWE